ncbi:MAG: alpha-amylase family glycosyl hydrolase, partial [Reichenbachiella sp.]
YRMKYFILLSGAMLVFLQAFSQTDVAPTVSPEFFSADEAITITYDVTGTPLSNLDDAWLWLWLPDNTGASIDSNVNPATGDTSASDAAKFTKNEEGGVTTFSITLTLTEFTDAAANDIDQVGMLLKGNDWGDGQSNDYLTNVTTGFTLQFSFPEGQFGFYESGEVIKVSLKTSEIAKIELYLDEVLIADETDAIALSFDHTVVDDGEIHILTAKANTSTDAEEVSYSYGISPTPPVATIPNGMIDGVNYDTTDDTKATLVITAPNKENVFVLGDFNNWIVDNNYLMNVDGERYWVTVNDLVPGKEYVFQYLIDGELRIGDPYTDKVSDPWDDQYIDDTTYPDLIKYPTGLTNYRASVLQTGQTSYTWVNNSFVAPDKENLMIYEVLIRDFYSTHSYKAVMDKLDYIEDLGVNVLELMPVNEFEGNESWGYNPNFFFAPDKYYGTKNDLKALVDECHSRGIAVIIDLVLNHTFNSSPIARMYWNEQANKPAADNPWYNEDHNFQNPDAHWGSDLNHESDYTQALVDSVNSYWMKEYNLDGFRFDFTKGFGNNIKSQSSDSWGSKYDADRIALLKRMSDKIWEDNEDAYVIFEHLAENSEEKELADYGIMLWGNMNGDYIALAKGFIKDIQWIYHESRGFSEPNVVGYMESHDEERVMWEISKSGSKTLQENLRRLQLNAAFFFTVPGPKMVWQFGEMGYDEELNDDRLANKPPHWEYLEDEDRIKLVNVYQSLMNLRSQTSYIDSDYFEWQSAGTTKWISIDHPDVQIVIAGNFGIESAAINPQFTSDGEWHDYLSEGTIEVTDFQNFELNVAPGGFKIYTSMKIDNYIDGDSEILGLLDDRISDMNVAVYPNPVNNTLNVQSDTRIKAISVYDLTGRKQLERSFNEFQTEIQLSVEHMETGIYIIELNTTKGRTTRRFIKD